MCFLNKLRLENPFFFRFLLFLRFFGFCGFCGFYGFFGFCGFCGFYGFYYFLSKTIIERKIERIVCVFREIDRKMYDRNENNFQK